MPRVIASLECSASSRREFGALPTTAAIGGVRGRVIGTPSNTPYMLELIIVALELA